MPLSRGLKEAGAALNPQERVPRREEGIVWPYEWLQLEMGRIQREGDLGYLNSGSAQLRRNTGRDCCSEDEPERGITVSPPRRGGGVGCLKTPPPYSEPKGGGQGSCQQKAKERAKEYIRVARSGMEIPRDFGGGSCRGWLSRDARGKRGKEVGKTPL